MHPKSARNVLVMILDIVQRVLAYIHGIVSLGVNLDFVAVVVRQSEDEVGVIVAMPGNCLHGDIIREMLLLCGNPSAAQHP